MHGKYDGKNLIFSLMVGNIKLIMTRIERNNFSYFMSLMLLNSILRNGIRKNKYKYILIYQLYDSSGNETIS
jgi:hypothetical protein